MSDDDDWTIDQFTNVDTPAPEKSFPVLPLPVGWLVFLESKQASVVAWRLATWLLRHHYWKRTKARPIRFPPKLWKSLHAGRRSMERCLHQLAAAGLISIEQLGPGKVTVVKIIPKLIPKLETNSGCGDLSAEGE